MHRKNSPVVFCLAALIALSVGTVGCGSGSNAPIPLTAVTATSHPLVAQYTIRHVHTGVDAWVEFGTDMSYGRQTSVVTNTSILPTDGGDTVNILVAGMKPKTTYHMRAHAQWTSGSWVDQDQTFTTGPIPKTVFLPTFTVAPPAPGVTTKPSPGVELFSFIPPATAWGMVTDLQGNVIWYCPGAAFPMKPMTNGHFLINRETDIQEVDLACNTIRDVSLDQVNSQLQAKYHITIDNLPLGLFHHDVAVLPNGHWIAIGQTTQNFDNLSGYPGTTTVLGDVLVDIDPTGNVGWAWSTFNNLDVNRHLFGLPDWTHANAVVYTSDGNLLVSMRNQSWVIKIDYADGNGTGAILWKLGDEGDFTLLSADSSSWFYGQHYPVILSTSGSQTVLDVFDDGNNRVYADGSTCGAPPAPYCFSRAATYDVDESTHVASLLWQYFPNLFTFWGGSIETMSNGDVEFDMSEPFLSTPASSLVTEVTQTETPQVVWQMTVTGTNAYRGYRIPSLYPGVTWNK